MSLQRHVPVAMLLALALASAAERKLELRGRIDPPPHKAVVTIQGVKTPFTATTLSDSSGRFRFGQLPVGAYTIVVFASGQGEVRQTVEVSPSFADTKGRVEVTISLGTSSSGPSELVERQSKVSVRELAIPDQAWDAYAEALKNLGQHDVDSAIRNLQRAVERAPQFSAAWNHLGTIAYQSGKFQEAEKYFREALKYEPGSFAPLVNLGGALTSQGKFAEALEYNQRAVRDRPDDALANSQLGANYFYLGDHEKALGYLQAAKRLDPSHFSRPQLLLAEIYLRRLDRLNAMRELEDFLARHPDAPNAAKVRELVDGLKKP